MQDTDIFAVVNVFIIRTNSMLFPVMNYIKIYHE